MAFKSKAQMVESALEQEIAASTPGDKTPADKMKGKKTLPKFVSAKGKKKKGKKGLPEFCGKK